MFELKKKRYGIKLGDNIYTYSQATLWETIDYLFFLENNFNILVFLEELFGVQSFEEGKYEVFLKDINNSDINIVMEEILNTRFKWFFSKKDNKNEKNSIPYNAYIVFLCKELNTSPSDILNNYTTEAIAFLTDWVIYNLNEQTEEGRRKNKIIQWAKNCKMSKKQLEAFKQARKLRDNQK